MSSKDSDPLKGIWFAVALLLVGMTAGFILLSLAYSGPAWVKVLVFAVYLLVVAGLVRGVSKLTRGK